MIFGVADSVEEGVGGQVDRAIPALAADPANGPWRDDGFERIMGQAVPVGVRAVEHQPSPPPTQVTVSLSSGRGRSVIGKVVDPTWMKPATFSPGLMPSKG